MAKDSPAALAARRNTQEHNPLLGPITFHWIETEVYYRALPSTAQYADVMKHSDPKTRKVDQRALVTALIHRARDAADSPLFNEADRNWLSQDVPARELARFMAQLGGADGFLAPFEPLEKKLERNTTS